MDWAYLEDYDAGGFLKSTLKKTSILKNEEMNENLEIAL